MPNDDPIVFVHGLLGWGRDKMPGLPYFGVAQLGIALGRLLSHDLEISHRAMFFPSVGPISSNHDRACELFSRLKGGDVHYGAEHSRIHGHRETVPSPAAALYPQWNSQHPLHFVGQAQGASTVRLLQHLLAQGDFFRDPDTGQPYPTSADWIASIVSLSGIHNGTPVAYIAGCSPEDGRIGRYSTAEYFGRTLIGLDEERGSLPDAIHRYFYSLGLDQWEDTEALLAGNDNAVYDLSIHGAQAMDFVPDEACTRYFSYVTACTSRDPASGYYLPMAGMNLLFRYPAEEMGRFTGPLRNLRYPLEDYSQWWESDGLAPVATQRFPLWGTARESAIPVRGTGFEKGVWYQMGRLSWTT